MLDHQAAGISYWNQMSSAWTFNSYNPTQVAWNGTAQVDILFDAIREDETHCYFNYTDCVTFEEQADYKYALAQTPTFVDLNLRVVVWNKDDYDAQAANPTYPQYTGNVPFYDRMMRHELGHDHYLADDPNNSGLMCGAFYTTCTPYGSATDAELSIAQGQYLGRPQPPTSITVSSISSTFVRVNFSGAYNHASYTAYVSTLLQGWDNKLKVTGLSPSSTSYTFMGLKPSTTYNFRIAAVSSDPSSWGEGSSFWVTAVTAPGCAGDLDCDGVPDATDNCPSTYNPDQKASGAGPRPAGPHIPGGFASNPASDWQGDACDYDPWIAYNCTSGDSTQTPDGFPACIKHMYGLCASTGDRTVDFSSCSNEADTDGDGCPDWLEIADVNNDRRSNVTDLLLVAYRISGTFPPDPVQDAVLDMNHDSMVGAADFWMTAVNTCAYRGDTVCHCGADKSPWPPPP